MNLTSKQIDEIISKHLNEIMSDENLQILLNKIVDLVNESFPNQITEKEFEVVFNISYNVSKAAAKHAVIATLNTVNELNQS